MANHRYTRKMGMTTEATVTVNPHESFRIHESCSMRIIHPMNAAAKAATASGITLHAFSM
jgi:hypothetical protein